MTHENLNEALDPKNIYTDNSDAVPEETEDSSEGYDILPSNGPGLAGDDGEQVIDDYDEDVEADEKTES